MYVCMYVYVYVVRLYTNHSSVKFLVHRMARTPLSEDLCGPTAPNWTKVPLKYGRTNGPFDLLEPSRARDELNILVLLLLLLLLTAGLLSSFRRKKNLRTCLLSYSNLLRIIPTTKINTIVKYCHK